MRFRSRDNTVRRITLPNGQIVRIGAEWREIPSSLHDAAFEVGCISEEVARSVTPPQDDAKAERKPSPAQK
ncbi:hypothetical protein [Chrysiogenes arsenatis]|uniref:hypothetical protein n=1 Tax=Chrysiogenes arsenatis TaxID=309797 RepID=UPI000487D091|nr:hypothetical protein [Chrysiogenes arsenatis]